MKISELPNAPDWLKEAKTENADVDWKCGYIVWHGGVWRDGVWHGGVWHGGVWRGGVWHDGDWRGGDWYDGVWRDGVWHGGVWHGGDWLGGEERLHLMAAQIGIVPDEDGMCVAYRTTTQDCHGRHNPNFVQVEGEYYEDDIANSDDATTCVKGLHVTTAAKAHTYFGVDHNAQMWRVRFHLCNLIACNGEKARISGGIFEKIERPF
jgi:hypothetical protein